MKRAISGRGLLRAALLATALGLAGGAVQAAAPEAPMGGMPMGGMSHGTGGACEEAKLGCASTVTPTMAPDGSLWLAFDVDNRVYVTHSTDLGREFSAPVAITPGKVHLDNGPDARSAIAVDGAGRVFVSYAIFKDNNYNAEVFFSRSTDRGESFSAPRPLVDNAASQRFAALAVGPDGDLFATWLDKRGVAAAAKKGKAYPGAALAYAWSKDGGAHFTPSRIALDNTCECCRIGVGFDGPDRPVVVFRNVFGGTVRDHAILSFKDADTPGPMHRVAVDNWRLNGCPHQGPSLAISSAGAYHVVWSTQGDARKGLFYARSTDKGVHFSAPMMLGDPDHERSRPYVTAVPGAIWIVWKEFDGEHSVVNGRVSHDDGVHWSPARAVAKTEDASDHPMLVNDGHKVYLSWMTKMDGYRFIPLEDKP